MAKIQATKMYCPRMIKVEPMFSVLYTAEEVKDFYVNCPVKTPQCETILITCKVGKKKCLLDTFSGHVIDLDTYVRQPHIKFVRVNKARIEFYDYM